MLLLFRFTSDTKCSFVTRFFRPIVFSSRLVSSHSRYEAMIDARFVANATTWEKSISLRKPRLRTKCRSKWRSRGRKSKLDCRGRTICSIEASSRNGKMTAVLISTSWFRFGIFKTMLLLLDVAISYICDKK